VSVILCRPKSLPLDKLDAAARRAVEINPDNAIERRRVARTPAGRRGGPRRIAVVVARKWPARGVRLSVSFMDNAPRALRSRILLHMNAWGASANVVFTETEGTGEVRIARLDSPPDMAGYWSYIGTEILDIDEDEPTLNLEGFTARTSEAEFRRVVRHEAGHTLGFDHEHMRSDIVRRIDRARAIAYFDRTNGWTPEEVEEQVLTPLAKKSIMGTAESDPLSIMCYQLPASIMKDRQPVKGGADINAKDAAFAASLYPKRRADTGAPAPVVPVTSPATADEDVDTFHLLVMDEFRPGASGAATSTRATAKFARVFASYGGARVISTMRLRADKGEEPTRYGRIIRMHERIKAYTNRERGSLPSDDEMVEFGGQLFETLFEGDVRRLYDEARTRQRHRRLDFVLTSMIPWISEKPWEFAYDVGRRSFLATEDLHFVRNVLTNVPADPIVRPQGPLRLLVAAAQPVGLGRLSVEQEVEVIRRGFKPLIDAHLVEMPDPIVRATPGQIHDALSTGAYQVLHFIGHGVYDEARREGCLVFENERGGEYMLSEHQLRGIFCKRGLSLVFLNACESGRGGRADFNKGVAQSLVAHGLPALVANQYSVLDSSATWFAQRFYWSLAHGLSVGQAAREARIAVNYSLSGELIDWAVPVLYARDPGMTLCLPSAIPAVTPAADMRRAARQATARRESKVAVWDIDDVFPALAGTLEGMNGAQTVFGFELADISVPLDAWFVSAAEGVSFLWAERMARRLQHKAAELGADVLACVTSHWLRDNDRLYLHAWWPGGRTPPVVILSLAGFDDLEPEGPDTDRAIANALVSALAGFYGDVATHARGAKDCPLAFNEKREFKYVAGPLTFDAGCRRQLARTLGGKLDALEALLRVFASE
jgi:CHAT domain